MKIIDLLKKIGILKTWKASGSYTNAKDRPDQFVDKDLYDGAQSNVYDNSSEDNQ